MSQVSKDVISQLAPTGVLRAGINLSNFLLVTGKSPTGDPVGVSPDMAAEIAQRLGVPVKYAPFKTPGELADAADTGAWDIGLIGAEPQRAEKIAFTAAYCEIEATYMVPAGSPLEDHRGCRQAGRQDRRDGTGRLRPLARPQHQGRHAGAHGQPRQRLREVRRRQARRARGARPRLITDVKKLPGARILDGQFTAVQQAIGTARKNTAGAAWLRTFAEEAKASGLVARLIERHKVVGLSVAPPA